MGGNSQVALTEGNKDSDMENGVRGKLPELYPIHKKQPTQEFVGWERENSEQERKKDYLPTRRQIWDLLIAGKLVLHAMKEPLVL